MGSMNRASFFGMLPCVKSVLSFFMGISPFDHDLIKNLDGADHGLRILFRDDLQRRNKRAEIFRIVFAGKRPASVMVR